MCWLHSVAIAKKVSSLPLLDLSDFQIRLQPRMPIAFLKPCWSVPLVASSLMALAA